jgi:hypothetical protein
MVIVVVFDVRVCLFFFLEFRLIDSHSYFISRRPWVQNTAMAILIKVFFPVSFRSFQQLAGYIYIFLLRCICTLYTLLNDGTLPMDRET